MNHTCLCLPSRSWYSFTNPAGGKAKAVLKNSMLQQTSGSIWSYCWLKFYIAEIGIIPRFLLLWPWSWPDDLHIRILLLSLEDISADPKQTFIGQGFRKLSCYIQTYIQTDRQTNRHTDGYRG